ncbi:MAG: hypothetical protein LW860_02040 [Xanthomonadaceae bacterium]|jgi:hypothetical protein|nr:hypothetical protein [Xanthomonadaceae bacterium]
MRTVRIALATALLGAAIAPSAALACGASLFGLAESHVVRTYRVPNPGHMVLYADRTLSGRELGDPAAFGRALVRSGHTVTVARDAAELGAALDAGGVDVVLVDADEAASVAADARARGSDAALLPVVHDLAGSVQGSLDGFRHTLAHDAGLREALRAINELIVDRARP